VWVIGCKDSSLKTRLCDHVTMWTLSPTYSFTAAAYVCTKGVDASPLMTWGEIEGTPFRLDGSDTPLVLSGRGPVFKIPDVPRRDRLLHKLAEQASKAHRAKKEVALKQATASLSRFWFLQFYYATLNFLLYAQNLPYRYVEMIAAKLWHNNTSIQFSSMCVYARESAYTLLALKIPQFLFVWCLQTITDRWISTVEYRIRIFSQIQILLD